MKDTSRHNHPVSSQHWDLSYKTAHESQISKHKGAFFFLILQIPLALLMSRISAVATLHALFTLAAGIIWELSGQKQERLVYWGAYVVGCEALWRMTDASVFWEFGKYAISFVYILAIFRKKNFKGLNSPLFYFIFLLPSIMVTIEHFDFWETREILSFNLSGPFALMICYWFFSQAKLKRAQIQKTFLALIAPIVGIAAIAILGTVSSSSIIFVSDSLKATSGGWGPNQVSAILGLGALVSFYLLFEKRVNNPLKVFLFGIMLVLLTQSALTFSRGGFLIALGGALTFSIFLLRKPDSRLSILFVVTIFIIFAVFIILPYLNIFTRGAITERFLDTNPTGRDLFVLADIETWKTYPLLGVGPGRSGPFHLVFYNARGGAHTEFSRMLAEHGTFGFISLLLLGIMAVQSFTRTHGIWRKALTTSLIIWSALYMSAYAMRTAAPAFMFGLSAANILIDKPIDDKAQD